MVILFDMGIGGSKEKPSKSVLGRMVRRTERLKSDHELAHAVEVEEMEPTGENDEVLYNERTGQVKPDYLRANSLPEDPLSDEQIPLPRTFATSTLSRKKQKNTGIPERLSIKTQEGGVSVPFDVSREAFETIVMKMFDSEVGMPREIANKIAKKLACEQLFVEYALNKGLAERARSAKSGDEQTQAPNKNAGTMEP